MLKLVMLSALAFASSAAIAQAPSFLISQMPTWHSGEFHRGVMAMDGQQFEFRQIAMTIKGEIRIVQEIRLGKEVVATTLVNPDNFAFDYRGLGGTEKTLTTDCSRKAMYPIMIGKTYSCRSEVLRNGKAEQISESWTFIGAGKRGQQLTDDICADHRLLDGDVVITARECYTPNGKWIDSTDVSSAPVHNI